VGLHSRRGNEKWRAGFQKTACGEELPDPALDLRAEREGAHAARIENPLDPGRFSVAAIGREDSKRSVPDFDDVAERASSHVNGNPEGSFQVPQGDPVVE
jgi:hypothetical protein